MKHILAYILVILFSAQSFVPILTGLNFKSNQNYYASICDNKDKPKLKCNDCCHLKKQLKEREEEKSTKDKQIHKKEQQFYIQEVDRNIYDTDLHPNGMPGADIKLFFANLYDYDIFHPPRT